MPAKQSDAVLPGLAALAKAVESHTGLAFSGWRQADLSRGLARMADELALPVDACLDMLLDGPWSPRKDELCARYLSVAETYFFREPRAFELLRDYAREKFARGDAATVMRVWSAACCTGEEAWSAAMTLSAALRGEELARCTVLGTDISSDALARAEEGVYGQRSFRHGGKPLPGHFESAGEGLVRISGRVRRMVSFSRLNLAAPRYPLAVHAMDIILCRNVLMYFSELQARQAIGRLRDCLVDGGWLVVSPGEASPELFPGFDVTRHPDAIWFRKTRTRPQERPSADFTDAHRRVMQSPNPLLPSSSASQPAAEPQAAREHSRIQQYCREAAAQIEAGQEAPAIDRLRAALYLDHECILANYLMASLLPGQGRSREALRTLRTVERLLLPYPDPQPVPGTEGMAAGVLRRAVAALAGRIAAEHGH